MTETTAKIIWNKLIVPNMKIHHGEEGDCIGYSCQQFFMMSDEDFNTFLEAYVGMEEDSE